MRIHSSAAKILAVSITILVLILAGVFLWPHANKGKQVSAVKIAPITDADAFYQKILERKSSPSISKLEQLERQVNAKQAFDSKDFYSAKEGFMQVLAENPQDFQAWIFLCKTLSELQQNGELNNSEKSDLQSALTKAKELAKTDLDKAVILSIGQPMAIEMKQHAQINDRLSTLLDIYPTEFAPYFLDIPQQAEIGTACVSWTYPLLKQRNFHYEDYISLTPKVSDLGVIARGNKLCLEGLHFGENYELQFRPGFAGEHDAKLTQDYTLNLFIPHRKPTIRFRERGYILSSFGPQVVPFIAVNVANVKVKIIHIPERNIHSVQNNWFSNQIGRWEIGALSEDQGEIVWEGTYHSPSDEDKTGISGLPLDKMLGKNLQPGVYVIEARISQNAYEEREFATQALIVSDIGLSTYNGPDGLTLIARDLGTAKPLEGVEITLIAKNNRELAKAKTQQNGLAQIPASLLHGKDGNIPSFVTAALSGKQFTVLNLRNEAFDLSDRGAQGREYTGAVEGYIFSERGIYRPGETVHLLSLLRKTNGDAYTQVPLTVRLQRPDGVIVTDTVLKDAGEGAYPFTYSIAGGALTGSWTVSIYLDPKGKEIGLTTFEVQDFVPPRIEVKANSSLNSVISHQTNDIQVSAQYYFGPPGANLKVETQSKLTKAENPFKKWQGYQFGLQDEKWVPLSFTYPNAMTDAKGHATISAMVDVQPQTSDLLQLETSITVFEVGGRGQATKVITPFWHLPVAIGIKPRFNDNITGMNANAIFDVIALNQKGELQNTEALTYTLFAEQHDYIWFRSGNQWQYEIVTRDRAMTNGKLVLGNKEPTVLQVPVESGLYRLEILNEKTGVGSSVRFSAGWGYSQEAPDRPDLLEMNLEKGNLHIKSPFAGELLIALAGEKFSPVYSGKIGTEGVTIALPIKLDQISSNGNYLIGTVFRPADVKTSQMPARAIGVTWVQNEKSALTHKIDFQLQVPERIKSNSTMDVKINVPQDHKKMRVSVALVDEGTLSLDKFETPNPFEYFFSQKILSYELRDSYGLLINPFGARPGSFDVGAGAGPEGTFSRALMQLPAKSYKVVSLYSGIIEANNQETLTIPFKVPEYSGKLRAMAVAWDETGLGSKDASVIVQDEIDLYLVLPRFLAPSDSATVPLILHNIEAKEGEYVLNIQTDNKQTQKKITLKKGEEISIPFDLQFKEIGVKTIHLQITGPDNFALSRTWEISVRPIVQAIALQQFGTLLPQKSLVLDDNRFNNFQKQTSQAILSIGSVVDFGSKQLIKELKEYPYLCLEQTASRLLATAYSTNENQAAFTAGFNQLSTLQKIDGSFALWSSAGNTEPWLSVYVADVIQVIKQNKGSVPAALSMNLNRWMSYLVQNMAHSPNDISLKAYASYLFAKEGKSSLGELRYFADNNIKNIFLKRDLAFIAAAFAYYGEAKLAYEWFDKAIASTAEPPADESFFGSNLRDDAILVALLGETTKDHPRLNNLANDLSAKANEAKYFSTQEKAWLIRAAKALNDKPKNYQLSFNQQKVEGIDPLTKSYLAKDFKNPMSITNNGQTLIFYTLSVVGDPIDTQKLAQQGFEINREIFSLNGESAKLDALKSGERYIVVIKGQRLNESLRHVLLVDLLPGGFEIENPTLMHKSLTSDFPWLGVVTPASRLEGRDDRFVAAYEFTDQNSFTAAYVVRAVTKGQYTYPKPYIEAMYQPQNFKYGNEQIIKILG